MVKVKRLIYSPQYLGRDVGTENREFKKRYKVSKKIPHRHMKKLSKKKRMVLQNSSYILDTKKKSGKTKKFHSSSSFVSSLLNDGISDAESSSSEFDFSIIQDSNLNRQSSNVSSASEDDETEYTTEKDTTFSGDSSVEEDNNDLQLYGTETNSEKSSKESEQLKLETSSFITFVCSTSNCFVVAMEHPVTFKFSGMARLKVISGSINILGYDLDATKDYVPVYSIPDICPLRIETKSCQAKGTSHCRKIVERLNNYVDENTCEKILTTVKDCHVLLIIFPNFEKSPVHFAGSFYRQAIAFSKTKEKSLLGEYGCNILEDDESTIKFTRVHDDVVDTIKKHTFTFASGHGPPPRIMIYGKKGVGKSVTLRYFVNRILSGGAERVFVLDADPGQSEFTIAGCVSLTEVNSPLLGPSYTHLKTPRKWKFVGEFSLDSTMMYFRHLREVMEYFTENFPTEILLINTAGWITGIGKNVLDSIKDFLMPTVEVELVHNDYYPKLLKKSRCSLFSEEANYPRKFIIPSHTSVNKKSLLPAQLRDIALLTYFGKLHPFFKREISTFNSFEPFCISATDIAIHIINSHDDDDQKICMLNGSIVALCSVNPSYIWDCADNSQPKRLEPESDFGECLGFGLVRSVNYDEKLLYIVTPLTLGELQFVNALIKGKLHLPNVVYKQQKITDKKLAYVSPCLEKKGWMFGDKVKRRTFRDKN